MVAIHSLVGEGMNYDTSLAESSDTPRHAETDSSLCQDVLKCRLVTTSNAFD